MKKLQFFFVVSFLFTQFSIAQSARDSSRLRISLLTCTPGAELYSVFGHSALRIQDSVAGTDIVYNYGTFDFNDPDFYTKFIRGKLLYFVSQVSYFDFIYEYQYFKRGVVEQVLQLSQEEKKKIQKDLFNNVREENRFYKYDFLFDNCTTRLRDFIFKTHTENAFDPPAVVETNKTFRDHLRSYLDRAEMQWTALGIDFLLGLDADKPMTISESMFLPDYLYSGVKKAVTASEKLEKEEIIAVKDTQPMPVKSSFIISPIFVIALLSVLLLMPSLFKSDNNYLRNLSDKILFIVTGMLGLFLLFMWFGTDHQSFSKNLNLIWAFPLNVYFAYKLNSQNKSINITFKVLSILIILLIALSMIYAGLINSSLYSLMLLLSFRYWMLSKKLS